MRRRIRPKALERLCLFRRRITKRPISQFSRVRPTQRTASAQLHDFMVLKRRSSTPTPCSREASQRSGSWKRGYSADQLIREFIHRSDPCVCFVFRLDRTCRAPRASQSVSFCCCVHPYPYPCSFVFGDSRTTVAAYAGVGSNNATGRGRLT